MTASSQQPSSHEAVEPWEKLFNPEALRKNLVAASIYLASYEMLREALIGHLRGFFGDDWTPDGGWKKSPEYIEEVLSLDKKEMVACAKWFKNSNALTEDDLLMLKELANQRNIVAHEMHNIIGMPGKEVSIPHLLAMHALTIKIDNWWIRNVEIPSNPEFDDVALTEDDLQRACSGRNAVMQMLIQVALGDDSQLLGVYQGIKERIAKKNV